MAWERRFEEKHGRRPSSSEQTEAVRTCYRNCRKIQAYFKAKSQKRAAAAAETGRPQEKQGIIKSSVRSIRPNQHWLSLRTFLS